MIQGKEIGNFCQWISELQSFNLLRKDPAPMRSSLLAAGDVDC